MPGRMRTSAGCSRRSRASRPARSPRVRCRRSLESDGYVFRFEKHFVYWKTLSNGATGIVTVLHERMHQIGLFLEDREQAE